VFVVCASSAVNQPMLILDYFRRGNSHLDLRGDSLDLHRLFFQLDR
jgi:hypothetical protein